MKTAKETAFSFKQRLRLFFFHLRVSVTSADSPFVVSYPQDGGRDQSASAVRAHVSKIVRLASNAVWSDVKVME